MKNHFDPRLNADNSEKINPLKSLPESVNIVGHIKGKSHFFQTTKLQLRIPSTFFQKGFKNSRKFTMKSIHLELISYCINCYRITCEEELCHTIRSESRKNTVASTSIKWLNLENQPRKNGRVENSGENQAI